MAAVTVVAIAVIFITGAITGSIVLVCLASRREDRRARLSREAPDRTTMAGRFLTSLYVRRPGDGSPYDYPAGDRAEQLDDELHEELGTAELLDEERRDCEA
jgi:hypothetical protein